MSSTPTLEPAESSMAGEDSTAPADGAASIARLGAFMAILGAIRLVGAAVMAVRMSTGSGLPSRGWGSMVVSPMTVALLMGAWPLLMGLALRRARWPELIKAGALTFAALSIGGMLRALSDWSRMPLQGLTIGSFRVPRLAWDRLGPGGLALGLAGTAQLLLELATAAYALVLAVRHHDEGGRRGDRPAGASRPQLGRWAVWASVAFLLVTVRLPAWSAYLELLTQSQWIRELILRDEPVRPRRDRGSPGRESAWASEARVLVNEGAAAWAEGKYAAAADAYARLAARLDAIPSPSMSPEERQLAAKGLNDWSWLLCTCPEDRLRNYPEAVRSARRAVELDPKNGDAWNTLGVACFRVGDWDGARNALYRSMELSDEGSSIDWFFLAMIHQRLGHPQRAREWYEKASEWTRRYHPGEDEYYRFEVEAAESLGLPRPERAPAAVPALADPHYRPTYPRGFRARIPSRPTDNRAQPR